MSSCDYVFFQTRFLYNSKNCFMKLKMLQRRELYATSINYHIYRSDTYKLYIYLQCFYKQFRRLHTNTESACAWEFFLNPKYTFCLNEKKYQEKKKLANDSYCYNYPLSSGTYSPSEPEA